MKKKIITGLVIISIAAASVMAFESQKDFRKNFGFKNHIARVIKTLDLSDTQKNALKELRAETKR